MDFLPVADSDAWLVRPQLHGDARGRFCRTWCETAFRARGLRFRPVQGNSSLTCRAGIVRGMHFQRAPRADAKLVRCSQGRIHDVIVDLRPDSPTRGRHYVNLLDGHNPTLLYVPAGFAHGFQSLCADVMVEYLMGAAYDADLYDGFRHDDPAIGIDWPLPVTGLSAGDAGWPPLAPRCPWLVREGA